jgi:hypothetical protein
MNSAITPEVLGLETQILEDSPMTESEEKELVIVKTAIKTAYADKLERDLAIGAGLLQIFRRKLYRGKNGGRTWEQWLAEESADLTAGRGALDDKTSQYLRGFYQFRCEVLQPQSHGSAGIPLPSSPRQVRPLLGQLESHPNAAVEMWKAACASAGNSKVPSFDQVNRAALAYKANQENEARRLNAAQQAARQKGAIANRTATASRAAAAEAQPFPSAIPAPEPSFPKPPPAPAPTVLAWELEKDDSSLDATVECRKLSDALNAAYKAVSTLRGILYSQTARYGRDYLGFLRQVDAGVYSIGDIDSQIDLIQEDLSVIADLLTADLGPGELAQSTLDVSAVPTR